ncbi:MAG: O-methyltransferase [Clostridia bacterium]
MDPQREALLARLKQFGDENDTHATVRAEKMLNITADTGLLLWMVIRAMRPDRILEIGTSNGYSTIWWADALCEASQQLTTVELNPWKAELARKNFTEAGVADRIRMVVEDAGDYLRNSPSLSVDFLFLDSERSEYVKWWPDMVRILAPRGLLVVDNAVDKADELVQFREVVQSTAGVEEVLVPIGNGELFIQKTGTR